MHAGRVYNFSFFRKHVSTTTLFKVKHIKVPLWQWRFLEPNSSSLNRNSMAPLLLPKIQFYTSLISRKSQLTIFNVPLFTIYVCSPFISKLIDAKIIFICRSNPVFSHKKLQMDFRYSAFLVPIIFMAHGISCLVDNIGKYREDNHWMLQRFKFNNNISTQNSIITLTIYKPFTIQKRAMKMMSTTRWEGCVS